MKLLGANWKTTLWGNICVLSAAIALAPKVVDFLPDQIEGWVTGVSGLIAVISGNRFASQTKDRNVTGGIVQQTPGGEIASSKAQIQSASVADTAASNT